MKKFNPPFLEDIKTKWLIKGEQLTDDEISALLGYLEAKEVRLQTIAEICGSCFAFEQATPMEEAVMKILAIVKG